MSVVIITHAKQDPSRHPSFDPLETQLAPLKHLRRTSPGIATLGTVPNLPVDVRGTFELFGPLVVVQWTANRPTVNTPLTYSYNKSAEEIVMAVIRKLGGS